MWNGKISDYLSTKTPRSCFGLGYVVALATSLFHVGVHIHSLAILSQKNVSEATSVLLPHMMQSRNKWNDLCITCLPTEATYSFKELFTQGQST